MTKDGTLKHNFVYWTIACRDTYIDVDVTTMRYNAKTDEWEEYGKDTVTITIDDLEELGKL